MGMSVVNARFAVLAL